MTLQTFIKTYKFQKRGAPKLIVRDIDELEKNIFVAYVDENDKSYDVKLVLDSAFNVAEHSCDCEQLTVCQHLVALANHLFENKKEKVVVKAVRKKKLTEIEQLIEEQDANEVILWLKNVLNKNKEWALTFKQNFGSKNIEFNKDIFTQIISECFISVAGRRKKLESNEVKKIAEAIESSLKPYLEIIFQNFSLDNYKWLWEIINLIRHYDQLYNHKSTRFIILCEKIQDNYIKQFLNLKDITLNEKIISFQVDKIFDKTITNFELLFFIKMYFFIKELPLLNKYVFDLFQANLKKNSAVIDSEYFKYHTRAEHLILQIIVNGQAFENHFTQFWPRTYENEYNLFLVENLIQINQFEMAEKYIEAQIERNYKDEYDLPYYRKLESIYIQTQNNDKLTELYLKIGLYTFDFNIYKHLKIYATETDFQKFYYKVSSKVKYAARYGHVDAFNYFYLLKKERNKEVEILDLFQYITNVQLIIDFIENAVEINAQLFLTNLLKSDIYSYNNSDEKIELLIDKITIIITKDIIVKTITSYKEYWTNEIYNRLKKRLAI